MVAVELLAKVVSEDGQRGDEFGAPVARDRLGSLGAVAVELGLGGVDGEVDVGPEAGDGGHDGVELGGGDKEVSVVMVADEGNVGVGTLELLEGYGLGQAINSAGKWVALVNAGGGVQVDGAGGASVDLAARGRVPVSHRMGNGGRSRLGSCVSGGSADRGESGLDVEGEASMVRIGACGGVESVVSLSGAIGDAYAELAVAYDIFDFGFGGLAKGSEGDLLEKKRAWRWGERGCRYGEGL